MRTKLIKKKTLALDTLRFITCGSVDDGKSTLIGRMLYDNNSIFIDQINDLKNATLKYSKNKKNLDFSLLADGLSSEREQKITIDVAYRYFYTEKRRFIIADTPGHEQFTKNMVTGASTADLAIILVNAKKGILSQTMRHSFICNFLGIKNIILAVNKMDLVTYSKTKYEKIVNDYKKLINDFQFNNIRFIPVSALHGENIVFHSKKMTWYKGLTILDTLNEVKLRNKNTSSNFIFPIQLVQTNSENKRYYLGVVRNGKIKKGDTITVLPSNEKNIIKRLFFYKNNLSVAQTGQTISIELKKSLDISRGDIITKGKDQIIISDKFEANIIWVNKKKAFVGRSYYMKIGHVLINIQISKIISKININNFQQEKADALSENDIAIIEINVEKKIPIMKYNECRNLGSFVLIDRIDKDTLGIGMIKKIANQVENLFYSESFITKKSRNMLNGHKSKVLWLTGLSGAGKSTLAKQLEKKLFHEGIRTYILDGDNLRQGINKDLGFSESGRIENIRRVAEIAKLMVDSGILVITALISPYENERNMSKALFAKNDFIEVFVNASIKTLEKRDVKGLYKKSREGKVKNFTGIDSRYEKPKKPDIIINTDKASIKSCTDTLYKKVKKILN